MRRSSIPCILLGVIAAWVGGAQTAAAQIPAALCAGAKAELAKDSALSAATSAAFPGMKFSTDAVCHYPFQLLSYKDTRVLLTLDGPPGDACHACGGDLSAYVFKGDDKASRPVHVLRNFAQTGGFGNPGEVTAITLGNENGFAVESGFTGQGYTTGVLSVFALQDGKIVELTKDKTIIVEKDNEGAVGEGPKLESITGKWTVRPAASELVIAYSGKSRGRKINARAVWKRQGDTLVLSSGRVPKEMAEAY